MSERTAIPRNGMEAAALAVFCRISPKDRCWALRMLHYMRDGELLETAFIWAMVDSRLFSGRGPSRIR
jgi:hypothetical protein